MLKSFHGAQTRCTDILRYHSGRVLGVALGKVFCSSPCTTQVSLSAFVSISAGPFSAYCSTLSSVFSCVKAQTALGRRVNHVEAQGDEPQLVEVLIGPMSKLYYYCLQALRSVCLYANAYSKCTTPDRNDRQCPAQIRGQVKYTHTIDARGRSQQQRYRPDAYTRATSYKYRNQPKSTTSTPTSTKPELFVVDINNAKFKNTQDRTTWFRSIGGGL